MDGYNELEVAKLQQSCVAIGRTNDMFNSPLAADKRGRLRARLSATNLAGIQPSPTQETRAKLSSAKSLKGPSSFALPRETSRSRPSIVRTLRSRSITPKEHNFLSRISADLIPPLFTTSVVN